ncbi:hypothetical protein BGX38DRAFT_1274860 [Terfezia claveryi]|nr:hypothetical protein BGX38DRAFT_1274860 [Terfezia claveryi]
MYFIFTALYYALSTWESGEYELVAEFSYLNCNAAIPDKYARNDSVGDIFRDSEEGTAQRKEGRRKEEDYGSTTEEDIWASDGPTNMEEEGDKGIGEATITSIDTTSVGEEDAEDEEEEDEEDKEEEEEEEEESMNRREKES